MKRGSLAYNPFQCPVYDGRIFNIEPGQLLLVFKVGKKTMEVMMPNEKFVIIDVESTVEIA